MVHTRVFIQGCIAPLYISGIFVIFKFSKELESEVWLLGKKKKKKMEPSIIMREQMPLLNALNCFDFWRGGPAVITAAIR